MKRELIISNEIFFNSIFSLRTKRRGKKESTKGIYD
jgi:hypothetical protein